MPSTPVNVRQWAPGNSSLTTQEQKLIAYLRSPHGQTLKRLLLSAGNLPERHQKALLGAAQYLHMERQLEAKALIVPRG